MVWQGIYEPEDVNRPIKNKRRIDTPGFWLYVLALGLLIAEINQHVNLDKKNHNRIYFSCQSNYLKILIHERLSGTGFLMNFNQFTGG